MSRFSGSLGFICVVFWVGVEVEGCVEVEVGIVGFCYLWDNVYIVLFLLM